MIAPEVEALIRASSADLRLGGDQAFYSPPLDYVQVSQPEAYFEPINWHRTALHELGHWTGQGMFRASDNLENENENEYARAALR